MAMKDSGSVDELRVRVLQGVGGAKTSPDRSATRLRRSLVFVIGFVAFLFWLLHAARFDRSAAARDLWLAFLLPAGCAALVSSAAVVRRRGMFGPPLGQLVACVLAGPTVLGLLALLASRARPVMPESWAPPSTDPHVSLGLACLSLLSLLAAFPPGDPVRAGWNGAAVGATAGAWLSVSSSVTCPSLDALHVLLHHVIWMPALTALGALAGLFYQRRMVRRA
jgi:hypothetical protein